MPKVVFKSQKPYFKGRIERAIDLHGETIEGRLVNTVDLDKKYPWYKQTSIFLEVPGSGILHAMKQHRYQKFPIVKLNVGKYMSASFPTNLANRLEQLVLNKVSAVIVFNEEILEELRIRGLPVTLIYPDHEDVEAWIDMIRKHYDIRDDYTYIRENFVSMVRRAKAIPHSTHVLLGKGEMTPNLEFYFT